MHRTVNGFRVAPIVQKNVALAKEIKVWESPLSPKRAMKPGRPMTEHTLKVCGNEENEIVPSSEDSKVSCARGMVIGLAEEGNNQ